MKKTGGLFYRLLSTVRNQNGNRTLFTHLSHIQIFRLRLGPDVCQIPSTLVGNGTAQSLAKYVTQIKEQREGRRGVLFGIVIPLYYMQLPCAYSLT